MMIAARAFFIFVITLPSAAHAKPEPGLTGQFATAIIDFSYQDLPPEVVERARYLIADSLATAIGAHHTSIYQEVENIIGPSGGDHLLLASGKRASMSEAVYLNSFAANVLDFDDSHTEVGHPGATIVPAALLLKEAFDKSEQELIEAVVAGYEFNIRWARSVFNYSNKFDGPWSSSTLQVMGTTVMAAKLLDLSTEEIQRALFFAASNTPIPVNQKIGLQRNQIMSGMKNNYGHAARGAVEAVLAARAGIPAEKTVLDGDQGQWRMIAAKEFHPEYLLADIGNIWELMSVQIKPYAACRWMHSSIDAFKALLQQVEPQEIESVEVLIYQFGYQSLRKSEPKTLLELQFSLPHIFGLLANKNSLVDLRLEDTLHEPAIEFSRKINLVMDQSLEDLFQKENKIAAEVIVTGIDGKEYREQVLSPLGSAGNEISSGAHLIKIRALVDGSPHPQVRELASRYIP